MFYWDPGSTAPDDGAMVIKATGVATGRHRRMVPDGRITPEMFGAVGDGVTDDGPALNAWLNAAGRWLFYLPGNYYSSIPVVRTNRGSCTLRGAGSGHCRISFSGANGLRIDNPIGGNLGGVVLEGFSVYAVGNNFAGDACGIYVRQPHGYQPGLSMNDVVVKGERVNNVVHEFPICLHIQDTSVTDFQRVLLSGINLFGDTIGMKISNTYNGEVGNPCVNHSLDGVDILAVNLALFVEAHGNPGVEGVNIKGFRGVAVCNGVKCNASYGEGWLTFSDFHVETINGYAIETSGWLQIMFAGTNLIIAHGSPEHLVKLNNAINVTGDVGQLITLSTDVNVATAYMFKLTGSGGGIALKMKTTPENGATKDLFIDAGYSGPRFDIERNWSGAIGTETSEFVTDLSNTARISGTPERAQVVGLIVQNNLDLQRVYSELVTINQDQTGPINNIFMRYGQKATIRFNTPMTVQSNAGIWLKNRQSRQFYPFETLSLYRSVENVEETGRNTAAEIDRVPYLSASYTLTIADLGKTFLVTANNVTITPPANAPVGWWCIIWSNNTTTPVTVSGPGISINGGSSGTKNKVLSNFGRARLECLANNWFGLAGDVTT